MNTNVKGSRSDDVHTSYRKQTKHSSDTSDIPIGLSIRYTLFVFLVRYYHNMAHIVFIWSNRITEDPIRPTSAPMSHNVCLDMRLRSWGLTRTHMDAQMQLVRVVVAYLMEHNIGAMYEAITDSHPLIDEEHISNLMGTLVKRNVNIELSNAMEEKELLVYRVFGLFVKLLNGTIPHRELMIATALHMMHSSTASEMS